MKQKKTAVLIAGMLILALVSGCGGKKDAASSGTASQAESGSQAGTSASGDLSGTDSAAASTAQSTAEPTPAVTLTQSISSAAGDMQIQVPDGWSDLRSQLDPAGTADQDYPIQTGDYDEESFLIINGEDKMNTSIASLQEYSDMLVQGVSANAAFSDVKKEATADMTLSASGFAAKKTKFIASYSGQQIAYWVYAAEGTSKYYQICCWTADDNASNAEPKFEAVVNSFTAAG